MVYYLELKDSRLIVLSYTTSEEKTKQSIPKTTVTTEGLFKTGTSSLKEKKVVYLDKLIYLNIELDSKLERLDEFFKQLEEDSIVYVTSVLSKTIVANKKYPDQYNFFRKYTGIDTDFINTIMSELFYLQTSNESFEMVELPYQEYFKSKIDLHPLIDTRQLFFYKDMREGQYFSYQNKENAKKNKDKSEEDSTDLDRTRIVLGKKTSTNIYTVFNVNKQPELDSLYAKFRSFTKVNYYTILLLNKVTDSKNIFYGLLDKLTYHEYPKRIETPANDVLLSEVFPAGISYYAFQTFYMLQDILDQFNSEEDNIIKKSSIDITNRIYDNKHEILHKTDFVIGYDYVLDDSKYRIDIFSSLDLPSRNRLKAIQKMKPRVFLIVLNEDNIVCRYYTILLLDNGDSVLYANYPANLRLLKNKGDSK